jgi:hypothetical protein
MPKTQRRQNLEDFANTLLKVHHDKMEEIHKCEVDPFYNHSVLKWTEGPEEWYLRTCILDHNPKKPRREYKVRRTYAKLTKSITEQTIYDECWIYIPNEYPCTLMNDSRNAIIGGYYFQGYSGYRPRLKKNM